MAQKNNLLVVVATCGFLAAAMHYSSANTSASFGAVRPATAAEQESLTQSDLNARIARIENGLLPAVIIKGQPAPAGNIADRMAHYKVPGVSVAFFDHGQIACRPALGAGRRERKRAC